MLPYLQQYKLCNVECKYGNNDSNDNNNKKACVHMRHVCMYSCTHARPCGLMHLCLYVNVYDAGKQACMHTRIHVCMLMYGLMHASVHEDLIGCV